MQDTLTTAEVASRLGVTPSAVSLMVKRGDLHPALKLPGKRGAFVFEEEAIAALELERAS